MSESIKTIKWAALLSGVFLVITYAISVNIEAGFIRFETIWISNTFLLTMFGGAFASMLVFLLCEIEKYVNTKERTERYLFNRVLSLFQALKQMDQIISDYLLHPEYPISENLLDCHSNIIQNEIALIQNTEYETFKQGSDSLMIEHKRFCYNDLLSINKVTQGHIKLRICMNECQIDNLRKQIDTKQQSSSEIISSKTERINAFFIEQQVIVRDGIDLADKYLDMLDDYCHRKFEWRIIKSKLVFPHISECMLN